METVNSNTYNNTQPILMVNTNINLNDNNLYLLLLQNHKNSQNHETIYALKSLGKLSNIHSIQQIYLDLAYSQAPITIAGVSIKFEDNVWDVKTEYKAGKHLSTYKYNFNTEVDLSDYHLVLLKLFTLYCITVYGLHNGTNYGRFNEIKNLIIYMQQNNKNLIEDMTVSDYENFYENRNIKYASYIKARRHVKNFLTFYSLIAKNVYTKELSNWFNNSDRTKINADIENNKTPLLPTSFYNAYTSRLFDYIFDFNQDLWFRGYAGLLFIGTQTGLRTSELTILRVQDLEVRTFKDKQIGIIHYRSTKSGNGKNRIYDTGETMASQKVIQVYETLDVLFKTYREENNTDLLVPRNLSQYNCNQVKSSTVKNISASMLDTFNLKVCLMHCHEWNLVNTKDEKSFSGRFVYSYLKTLKNIPQKLKKSLVLNDDDIISFPIIKQFRVYVASEWRERGVDDRTISSLLNHHCVEMYGYYVRPKHTIQEDIDFSREIIKDIVWDNTKILGPKGDALTNKINQIIKENHFNVETDLEAIIENVCNEVPIRAKLGGFCMKSNPRRECRHDAATDEFMCAYGCCPNHCHMYFMLPTTYNKAKNLYNTLIYNISAGFSNAAEKEAYKLRYTIENELLPELLETKNELTKRTIASIVDAHPEMNYVISKLDELETETKLWLNQVTTTLSSKQ